MNPWPKHPVFYEIIHGSGLVRVVFGCIPVLVDAKDCILARSRSSGCV